MVLAHDASNEVGPAVRAEALHRAIDRVAERLGLVAAERESVARSIPIQVVDGLGEPADGVHDRHGPVAERDELTQAARLEARGHEKEIAAGVDALRERRVEAEREPELARVLLREVLPLRLVRGVARAEDDELTAAVEDPRRRRGEEVHPLLLDETADDTKERRLRVDGEATFGLERGLVLRFPARVVDRVVRGDARIGGRVEGPRIDAVRDPDETAPARAKQILQPLAERRREDLLRVLLAHRAHDVGGRDRARHRVALVRVLDGKPRAR